MKRQLTQSTQFEKNWSIWGRLKGEVDQTNPVSRILFACFLFFLTVFFSVCLFSYLFSVWFSASMFFSSCFFFCFPFHRFFSRVFVFVFAFVFFSFYCFCCIEMRADGNGIQKGKDMLWHAQGSGLARGFNASTKIKFQAQTSDGLDMTGCKDWMYLVHKNLVFGADMLNREKQTSSGMQDSQPSFFLFFEWSNVVPSHIINYCISCIYRPPPN